MAALGQVEGMEMYGFTGVEQTTETINLVKKFIAKNHDIHKFKNLIQEDYFGSGYPWFQLMLDEVDRLMSVNIYPIQTINYKNWYLDTKQNRAYFLQPHFLSRNAKKVNEIGLATYKYFTNNKRVRNLHGTQGVFLSILFMALSAFTEEVSIVTFQNMKWTYGEMESRKMSPVDLSVCETLLVAAFDEESAFRITQPLKDIHEKVPAEVSHYKVALEKIYLEFGRANKLNEDDAE